MIYSYEVGTIFKSLPKNKQIEIVRDLATGLSFERMKNKAEHPFYVEEIDTLAYSDQEDDIILLCEQELKKYETDNNYDFESLKSNYFNKVDFHTSIKLSKQNHIPHIKVIKTENFEESSKRYDTYQFFEDLLQWGSFKIFNNQLDLKREERNEKFNKLIDNLKINIIFDEIINAERREIYTITYKNKVLAFVDDFQEYKNQEVQEVFEKGIQFDFINDLNIVDKELFLNEINNNDFTFYDDGSEFIKISDYTDDKAFVVKDDKLIMEEGKR